MWRHDQLTFTSSTSNTNHELGGMSRPAPLAPYLKTRRPLLNHCMDNQKLERQLQFIRKENFKGWCKQAKTSNLLRKKLIWFLIFLSLSLKQGKHSSQYPYLGHALASYKNIATTQDRFSCSCTNERVSTNDCKQKLKSIPHGWWDCNSPFVPNAHAW